MVLTESKEIKFESKAIDFTLIDQITGKEVNLYKEKGEKATIVIFMCNHCPFVLHIISKFVEITNAFISEGVNCIAINSNDVKNFPDDSPNKMKELAEKYSITFPYVFDETQEIAKAYDAACTPDIYVYDKDLMLKYHGRFDESTPGNNKEVTGEELKNALLCITSDKEISDPQHNSVGCNIKWK